MPEIERIIVGIDPGTNILGFGVIRVCGRKASFVDMGVLDIRKEKDAYAKLKQIFETVSEVCKTYHATEMALES
ncbi:MAG: crossover junction endodeoxyribonuclease RuvC, partial [Bacteroidales bacterium]|nr:crossover junction endodeoxyribonuclease RuvC [Bacteroidales bacterium]